MCARDAAKAERRSRALALQFSRVVQERERLLVAGHRAGRHDGGRAVAGVGADHRLERLGSAVHEIGVVAAMHMEIDEPRGHEVAGGVDCRS